MLADVDRNRRRAAALPALSADPTPAHEQISLLIPLRNDERRVARCVLAVLRQIRVPRLDIVFLDAGSTDLTRRMLLQAAADDPRVRLLVGSPTPPGWCVHAHACEQLAVAARGKVFVFADPGLALAPGAVAAAVAALRGTGGVTSGIGTIAGPGCSAGTGAGTDGFDLVVAKAHRRIRPDDSRHRGSGALQRTTAARLLAIDAEMYWRVGGHCNSAHDAHGDSGLIRAVYRAGGRVTAADGRHAIEFLDGSLWPPERAVAVAGESGAASRLRLLTDTENSILHSFTDTARRLLNALALMPPVAPPHPAHLARRAAGRGGTGRPVQGSAMRRPESGAVERSGEVRATVSAGGR